MKKDIPKNLECFDDLSDEEASYFAGLLLSDGCLRDTNKNKENGKYKGNSYQIVLRLIDREVIEHFVKFVGLNESRISVDKRNIEKGRKPYYGITTGNKYVVRKTMDFGMVEDKSHKEIVVPEKVHKFGFLRGYLDGDGCITKNYVVWCTSSKEMQLSLSNCIKSLGFDTKLYEQKQKNCILYTVKIAGGIAETIRFLRKMYNTKIPYMTRKYKEFERILQEVYGNHEPSSGRNAGEGATTNNTLPDR